MQQVAIGLAALLAVAIIGVGVLYLSRPFVAVRSFGLPLPGDAPPLAGWLRLKGVRDIVAGLTVLSTMIWGGPRFVGLILLVQTLIPIGDLLVILGSRGSARRALGIHGVTALVMLLAALPLLRFAA